MPEAPPRHRPGQQLRKTRQRITTRESYGHLYDYKWQKYRAQFLARNAYCVDCLDSDPPRRVFATVVDHRIDHKGDPALFYDTSNHQALCKHCHDQKTYRTNVAPHTYAARQ